MFCRGLSAIRGHADRTQVGCGRFTVYSCGQTSKSRPRDSGRHGHDVRTGQCTLPASEDLCGYLYHGDRNKIMWVVWYTNILYYGFLLVPHFFFTARTLGWRFDDPSSGRSVHEDFRSRGRSVRAHARFVSTLGSCGRLVGANVARSGRSVRADARLARTLRWRTARTLRCEDAVLISAVT